MITEVRRLVCRPGRLTLSGVPRRPDAVPSRFRGMACIVRYAPTVAGRVAELVARGADPEPVHWETMYDPGRSVSNPTGLPVVTVLAVR